MVAEERVQAVLVTLNQRKPRQLKRILQVFHMKLRTELRKEEAQIQYAGELKEQVVVDLKNRFVSHYDRELRINLREEPTLIGGVRIYVGDDVWDSSIRGKIERLGSRFKD